MSREPEALDLNPGPLPVGNWGLDLTLEERVERDTWSGWGPFGRDPYADDFFTYEPHPWNGNDHCDLEPEDYVLVRPLRPLSAATLARIERYYGPPAGISPYVHLYTIGCIICLALWVA